MEVYIIVNGPFNPPDNLMYYITMDKATKAGVFVEITRQPTSLLIVLVSASRTAYAIMCAGINKSMCGRDMTSSPGSAIHAYRSMYETNYLVWMT